MLMDRGTLVRWNEEKGFGFIKPERASAHDIFIHISVLKHMARKPIVDDQINYVSEWQRDGKIKAVKANIEGVAIVASKSANKPINNQHNQYNTHRSHSPQQNQRPIKSSFLSKLAIPLIIVVAAVGYSKYQQMNETIVLTNDDIENMQWELPAKPSSTGLSTRVSAAENKVISQPQFRCETGKTHCSQMRSCAEATFYIKNCPGTQMDGDNDGVPCERQHCSW
ncbi:excalibur calcium-binding domain-containing protein [Shewanella sp. 0m-11]